MNNLKKIVMLGLLAALVAAPAASAAKLTVFTSAGAECHASGATAECDITVTACLNQTCAAEVEAPVDPEVSIDSP